MKKLALAAMCVGALGLAACGGGGGDGDTPDATPISFTDANNNNTPDAGATAKCNPVTNTGCMPGEKCTVIVDSGSGLAVTDCAPDGTVPLGGTCMTVAGQGYDDCVAKTLCSGGTCREICGSAPNTCTDGECSQYGGLFDDVEGAGLCSPTCDPVAQDCADATDGCFIVLSTGVATCEGQNEAGTAGEECSGPDSSPTACWVNGCAKGHLPFLDAATSGGRALCTPFCTPIDADSTNFAQNKMGDPAGVTCPTVGWGNGIQSANISCRYLGYIYSNVAAPDTVGVCLDFTADYGSSGMPIGSCENQTPGANDPGNLGMDEVWVPGCLLGPSAATGKSFDKTKLPKYQGDVSVLNEAIRNHTARQ